MNPYAAPYSQDRAGPHFRLISSLGRGTWIFLSLLEGVTVVIAAHSLFRAGQDRQILSPVWLVVIAISNAARLITAFRRDWRTRNHPIALSGEAQAGGSAAKGTGIGFLFLTASELVFCREKGGDVADPEQRIPLAEIVEVKRERHFGLWGGGFLIRMNSGIEKHFLVDQRARWIRTIKEAQGRLLA